MNLTKTAKGPVKALLSALFVLGLAAGIRLLCLGPFGIRPADERVLAQLTTTNGPTFVVVAHRNESAIEAYTVHLYRINDDGRTAKYLVAFEDSYWWDCSLHLSHDGREVEVSWAGQLAARYSFDKQSVIWADHVAPQDGEWDQSGRVQKLVATMK
jgi:hypothetical protein